MYAFAALALFSWCAISPPVLAVVELKATWVLQAQEILPT